MATTNTFIPATGSQTEWNAAYYRLEDYFRALHLVNKVHQSQIILRLLEKAADRHARDTEQSPTTLAMEEARVALDDWCGEILERPDRIPVVGLISLLAIDAAEKWPLAFLNDEVPADFRHEMRESDLRSGPDLQVSSMVPRPIDVGAMLHPGHIVEVLGSWGLTFVVALVLTAASASVFLLMR